MPPLFKDYYAVMQLDFSAETEEIKQAYRRLVRDIHPDRHPDKQDFFTQKLQELNEAYQVLSHVESRMNYDGQYRQKVLGLGPQYEIVKDTTPPDETPYKHRFTKVKKRTLMYLGWLLLAVILFRYLR